MRRGSWRWHGEALETMKFERMDRKFETLALWATVGVFFAFPVMMAVANVAMALVLVLWLFAGAFPDRWKEIRHNPVAVAALALYGVIAFGALYSPAPSSDILLHLEKYAKLLIAVVLMSLLVQPEWPRRCMQAFVWAMGFILASTWLSVWWEVPWSNTHTRGFGVSHHVFGDYITQNVMMAFFALLALLRAWHAPRWSGRTAWGAVALLASVSITHLSDGRTGYLLLAVVVVVFALTALKGRVAWLTLILATALMLLALFSSGHMRDRFTLAVEEAQRVDQDRFTSIGNRVYLYKTVPALIAQKPLLGHGTGAYHGEICRMASTEQGCHIWVKWHPHNQFLFFAADHGALGLMAYLALLGSLLWRAGRTTDPQTRVLLIGLTGLLVADSMVNSPLWSGRESHFFVYMMALLACKANFEDQNASK